MTNVYTKIVIIAVAALGVALTGCKKETEGAPSFVLETSSMDFEWGQTKELSYTAYRIRDVKIPTEIPQGWSCTLSGGRFIITAPKEGATATTGTIKLEGVSDNDATLTRELKVAVSIAEEIAAGANSIIVSQPNKRYKFRALSRGNEAAGETLAAATRGTRVWTTSSTAIVNVSFENGYLFFATGDEYEELEEANALVAVTDKDGKILWSWHIWATDFDPAANPDIIGDFRVMNRNLGAFTNSNASPEDVVRSYGLYYQWGRKDPFIGPATWNSTTPATLYDSSNRTITHEFLVANDYDGTHQEIGSIEYAIANPNTFIAGSSNTGFDWQHSAHRTNLWNSDTRSKTIYDPCPHGWRVAPPTIWASFTTTGGATSDPAEFSVEGEYKYGWTFMVDSGMENHPPLDPDEPGPDIYTRMFFPAAGRRSFSPTLAKPEDNFTNVVNDSEGVGYPVGFYWSNEHPVHAATTTATYPFEGVASLVFRHNYVNPAHSVGELSEHAPAGGFPLRCVAESAAL